MAMSGDLGKQSAKKARKINGKVWEPKLICKLWQQTERKYERDLERTNASHEKSQNNYFVKDKDNGSQLGIQIIEGYESVEVRKANSFRKESDCNTKVDIYLSGVKHYMAT